MKTMTAAAFALALAGAASAAHAQSAMVTANDPQGMVALLETAGYEPELTTDSHDDPMILMKLDGWNSDLIFYGCDADAHDKCDSVQLSTGFDADEAVTAQTALQVSDRFRFASVSLDDEGDIYLRWDIHTGDGIPAKIFLQALRDYTLTLDDASEVIFAAHSSDEE